MKGCEKNMKFTVLMEDTCGNPCCEYEHGLCIYIETKKHKILADTGASSKTLVNARQLGIQLQDVDTVILSHGHYDHSGGLLDFAKLNEHADIYLQKSAFGDYYHGERYIGIDKEITKLTNLHLLEGNFTIDSELELFSGISGRRHWPQSNLALTEKRNGVFVQDDFQHEQCLVIRGEKKVLVSGCAHNGILNILDRYQALYGGLPDVVISGFHMYKKEGYTTEEKATIRSIAEELAKLPVQFYTGHCTGEEAMELMEEIMQDQLIRIHCGTQFHL